MGIGCVIITPLFSGTYDDLKMRKTIVLLLIFLFSLTGSFVPSSAAEFIGKFPTGLLQLEKKHAYYLFIPQDYSPEKSWPIVFLIGKRGEDPKEVIEPWVEWAKRNQFLIAAPPNLTPEKDVPASADEWLLDLKKEIAERYKIDPLKTFVIGLDAGAHYAAYLGTRYPGQFSAAALIHEAWSGPYEKLIKPSSDRKRQISFYVSMDPKEEKFSKVEKRALEFENKGYRITFEPLKSGEDLSALRDRLSQWFQEDADARSVLTKRPRKTMKEKVNGFFSDFFEV